MQKLMIKNTAHVLDPVLFAKDCFAFEADGWQRDVLRSNNKRIILNCCRQSGKSTVSAIMAVYRAVFFPNSLILVVSPSQRQSSELFKKITQLLNILEDAPRKVEDNKLSVGFDSGSRIVSLPSTESTVRGYSSPALVIIDEASRVSDDLYYSLRPMLAVSGGQLVLLSTPFGKRGFFYQEWENNDNWQKVEITAEQCPRITTDFLEEEKKILGSWWYEQEYFCMFKEGADSVFTVEEIENAFDDDLLPWNFGSDK